MAFTALLDTAIGLALLYLGAALFVTITNESLAGLFKLRGRELARNLETLLARSSLLKQVTASPVFKPVLDATDGLRAYVDPNVLAQALVACLGPQPGTGAPPKALTGAEVLAAIDRLPESRVKHALWSIAQSVGAEVGKLTNGLSVWIDRSLIVLGEGYKRQVQALSFGLGLVIAVGFNIDTLTVSRRLYQDKELREAVAAGAEQLTRQTSAEVFTRCMNLPAEARERAEECAPIRALGLAVARRNETLGKLPIGWQSWEAPEEGSWGAWALRGIGWLLTALAISLGAPFWFDLLSRFANVRTTIRKPDVTPT